MASNPLTSWQENSFKELRREMDHLFDSFFGQGRLTRLKGGDLSPSIDIKEDEKAIVLTAELPGMAEKDIDINIANNTLTLSGEKKLERDEKKDNYHVMERQYGSFTRSIPIPDRADADKISAAFDKGVLTVTIPKRPEAATKARKVEIGRQSA